MNYHHNVTAITIGRDEASDHIASLGMAIVCFDDQLSQLEKRPHQTQATRMLARELVTHRARVHALMIALGA